MQRGPWYRQTLVRLTLGVTGMVLAWMLAVHLNAKEFDRRIAGPYRLYRADGWTVVTAGGWVVVQPNVAEIAVFGSFIIGRVENPGENRGLWDRVAGHFVIDIDRHKVVGVQLSLSDAANAASIAVAKVQLWSTWKWAVLP